MNTVHFSSKTDEWETPQNLFDALNSQYHFDIDVCALSENKKCQQFFIPEQNGLKQDWKGHCWMNPPYGRGIGAWVKKAFETGDSGGFVVCLLPARTDTAWFHDYCLKGKITYIRGRLKFGNSKNSAPFPSMIVVFGKGGGKIMLMCPACGGKTFVCDSRSEKMYDEQIVRIRQCHACKRKFETVEVIFREVYAKKSKSHLFWRK